MLFIYYKNNEIYDYKKAKAGFSFNRTNKKERTKRPSYTYVKPVIFSVALRLFSSCHELVKLLPNSDEL